jgi:hypothetical protein
MNTIIHITDNSLDPKLAAFCRNMLVSAAHDIPIISVSQRPIDLGTNICVGDIGRNWISLYNQLLAGISAATTPWVAICEHDCLYSHEHLSHQPPDPGVFWYNSNCWLVQWGGNHPELNGMYSYWPKRLALSQLICHKDLLAKCITERLDILQHGGKIDHQFLGCGEPGVVSDRAIHKAQQAAASGKPIQLQRYLKDYLQAYTHKVFSTIIPNLDIRHSSNFTGPKRGKKRTYILPYWGRFANIIASMEDPDGNIR